MACSKQAGLDAFLRTQPEADDADLNEEPEEENIAHLLVITTHLSKFSKFHFISNDSFLPKVSVCHLPNHNEQLTKEITEIATALRQIGGLAVK